ncbi:MAG: DUF1822 family protein [Elainellaceae cyanobacterium]
MMSYSTEMFFDSDRLSPDTIVLNTGAIARAVTQSETVRPADQWQAYFNAVALSGFQQWLAARGLETMPDIPTCSVNQPIVAGLLKAVCGVQVNGFHLCLLPTGSVTDEMVAIPRATVELAQFVPHLFVGLEVQEELHQVKVWGCLRWDQLEPRIREQPTDADWTYQVPLAWFNPNPDSILLYLRCLEPPAIERYAAEPPPLPSPDTLRETLAVLAPRIQSSQRPIWKLLNWEQAAAILIQPELGQAFLPSPSPSSVQRIAQAAMNVGQWLQGQLDQVAQEWDWWLLPPLSELRQSTPSPVRDGRSPTEQFEEVITTLTQRGITIPPQARGAYRDLTWQNVRVRLYAVIWDLSILSGEDEWSLLLMLGAQPNHELPLGTTLWVRDEQQVLDQRILRESRPDAYLFSQVIGNWHEQFWVTIDLTNGATITLPPFTFAQ